MPMAVTANRSDILLDAVGAGPADRVLVLGRAGSAALLAAAHRGCRGGAAHVAPPAHPEPAEVVLAPAVASAEAGDAVARCARRALTEGGRLAVGLVGTASAALARSLVASLRAYGFERVRLRGNAEGATLVCRRAAGVR